MTIVPVEYIPDRSSNERKSLDEFFKMFMKMNIKYGQVHFTDFEYATGESCRGSLHSYIYRNPDLPVDVRLISGSVYVVRTDMEG